MVDTLSDRYTRSRRPVVFIEHDLDNMDKGQQRRQSMWFQARAGANSAQTPLIMVDSGWKWAEGAVSNRFEQVYSGLVDDALAHPPDVDIEAYYRRTGSVVDVTAKVTNWTEASLAGASLTAILYENKKVLHTGRSGRAVVAAAISGNVQYGESGTYQLQLAVPTGVTWSQAHIVVVVDRRKLAGAGYEAMQGALAVEGVPPTATPDPPTATPVPTDEPTATATTRPTDPPEPTSTFVPTIAPTPVPTEAPRYAIFAPALYRRYIFEDAVPSR